MSDQKIIVMICVGVGLALFGGGWYVLHATNGTPRTQASAGTTSVSPAPSSPTNAMRNITTPTPKVANPMSEQSELLRLRAENERLRQELKNEMAAASVPPQPPPQQTSSPQQPRPAITIEELQALGQKLAPAMQRYLHQNHEEAERMSAQSGLPKSNAVFTADAKYISADIKRTDSVINPLVGEVVLQTTDSTEDKQANFIRYGSDRHTISLAKDNGRWRVLQHTDRCESDDGFPRPEQSRKGEERHWDLTLIQRIVDATGASK